MDVNGAQLSPTVGPKYRPITGKTNSIAYCPTSYRGYSSISTKGHVGGKEDNRDSGIDV